jgi:hypothetical protein
VRTWLETIKRHRAIAIGTPCIEALECADQRYGFGRRVSPDVGMSVVLTVNIGEE